MSDNEIIDQLADYARQHNYQVPDGEFAKLCGNDATEDRVMGLMQRTGRWDRIDSYHGFIFLG